MKFCGKLCDGNLNFSKDVVKKMRDGNPNVSKDTHAGVLRVCDEKPVGAPLRGCPSINKDCPLTSIDDMVNNDSISTNNIPSSINEEPSINNNDNNHKDETTQTYGKSNTKYNTSIGVMVGWFKTMTTNGYINGVKEFGWERFNKRVWQRNYFEEIIKDDNQFNKTKIYIKENPIRWSNKE